MVSIPTTRWRWRGPALVPRCAAAVAAVALVGVTPAMSASRRAAPPPRPGAAADPSATVARVLLPAVAEQWSLDLLLLVLGHPLLVTSDGGDPGTRWLVHARHDRRLVIEVTGHDVTAALLTVRTTAADARDAAFVSLSGLLGPPRRSGAHEARWSHDGVEVRLAGWRGEFNVEVRRRRVP